MNNPAAIDLEWSNLFASPSTLLPRNEKLRLKSSSSKKSAGRNTCESSEKVAGADPGARELFIL